MPEQGVDEEYEDDHEEDKLRHEVTELFQAAFELGLRGPVSK